MRLLTAAFFFLFALTVGCDSGPIQSAEDQHAEGKALQRWAVSYDDSAGIFKDTVGIADDGSTFQFTATSHWDELSDDEQEMALTNALNAVNESWCAQADHRSNGDLTPGIGVKILDDQGNVLKWKVGGPGLSCR